MTVSVPFVSSSVVKETLHCFSKMLTCQDLILTKPSPLMDLLKFFQPKKVTGIQSSSSTRDIDCLYNGVFTFLEGVLDVALCFSFMLSSEVVLTLESVIFSLQKFLEKPIEGTGSKHIHRDIGELITTLCKKLSFSAKEVLSHDWNKDVENGWKGKGKWRRRLFIFTWKIASPLHKHSMNLHALFCLRSVSLSSRTSEENNHGFTTLCSSTFSVWYKELHEQNLVIVGKLVKEVVHRSKSRTTSQPKDVQLIMEKLHQSVLLSCTFLYDIF